MYRSSQICGFGEVHPCRAGPAVSERKMRPLAHSCQTIRLVTVWSVRRASFEIPPTDLRAIVGINVGWSPWRTSAWVTPPALDPSAERLLTGGPIGEPVERTFPPNALSPRVPDPHLAKPGTPVGEPRWEGHSSESILEHGYWLARFSVQVESGGSMTLYTVK